jgi:adhesin/invasin
MNSAVGAAPARLALLAIVALAGCGGEGLVLPNEGEPAEVAPVRGNGQNGAVGEPVEDSLVVEVTDRFGNPVTNLEVSWVAEGGGSVEPAHSITSADGRAGTTRILGSQPGTYTTVATAAGLPEKPAIFTATAVTGRLVLTTQPSFVATSGVPFERQPVLQLQNTAGNPVAQPNVAVTVQIASGGGTLAGVTTELSDAEGAVTFSDLAISGSSGARTLIFAADGFASTRSAPVGVGVGGPATIALAAGNEQTGPAGVPVPIAPAVIVRDGDGTPVAGVPIQFTVTSGGGSVTGASPLTGDDGVARVGGWTLGGTAGENTLRAEVPGAELGGGPIVFTATGEPGPVSAEQSTVSASPTSIAITTGSSTITVTARDAFGNPVSGAAVVLAATGSGNNLVQPGGPTDGSGVATGGLSATELGAHIVSATINGTGITQTATVTVSPGQPTADNSSATVPNGTAGAATAIQIQLKDAQGNLVPGAATAIAVRVSGANTVASVPVTDNGGGAYTAAYTPTVAGADQVEVRVSGALVAGAPFTSIVSPGPVNPGTSTAEVTRAGSIFATIHAVVTARDAQGNPVGHGGDHVEVTVNNNTPVVATDLGNGTYDASVFAVAVNFVVTITLNGTPIQGSPFQL